LKDNGSKGADSIKADNSAKTKALVKS
jgi:hypothetical protein